MHKGIIEQYMASLVLEKIDLICEIAKNLKGVYKPCEYGKVILPLMALRRFDCISNNTKTDTLYKFKLRIFDTLNLMPIYPIFTPRVIEKISKNQFYNTSKFTFEALLLDKDNIEANFELFVKGFSDPVQEIISTFNFNKEIKKLVDNDLFYVLILEFANKVDLNPDGVSSPMMDKIFKGVIKKLFTQATHKKAKSNKSKRCN